MGVTTHGYNALDQLISVTDPRGLAITYTYNGLGDLKQVSPDTGRPRTAITLQAAPSRVRTQEALSPRRLTMR
jgi:YD repeat-containing protein